MATNDARASDDAAVGLDHPTTVPSNFEGRTRCPICGQDLREGEHGPSSTAGEHDSGRADEE